MLILFSFLLVRAQTNQDSRFIACGIDFKGDYNVPFEFHIKFIHPGLPGLALKYSRLQYTLRDDYMNLSGSSAPAATQMNYTETTNGHSFKLGYIFFDETKLSSKRVTYAAIYLDYVNYVEQLNLNYTDPIFGFLKRPYPHQIHEFGGEVEAFTGLRIAGGHICIGLAGIVGYKNPALNLYSPIISKYPLTNLFYSPGRGYGIYTFFVNALLSVSASF